MDTTETPNKSTPQSKPPLCLSPKQQSRLEAKKERESRKEKVANLLLNRLSTQAIANTLGISPVAVGLIRRELEHEWRGKQQGDIGLLKARELEALDQMERECVIRMAMVDALGLTEEQLQEVGVGRLRVMLNDEGLWFDRRLRIMQERLKLLGAYPKPEPEPKANQTLNDNRSIVLIMPPDVASGVASQQGQSGGTIRDGGDAWNGKPRPLGEFMRGILGIPNSNASNNEDGGGTDDPERKAS